MHDAEYRLIPLHRGNKVVAHVRVDTADYERLSRFRWRLDSEGYPYRMEKHYLHRDVLQLEARDGQVVDHLDGDRLDCRRSQLRLCPRGHADNGQNLRLSGRNKSGYRGVSWASKRKGWRAAASVRGKTVTIGHFPTAAAAGTAAAAFRAQHMPFARD